MIELRRQLAHAFLVLVMLGVYILWGQKTFLVINTITVLAFLITKHKFPKIINPFFKLFERPNTVIKGKGLITMSVGLFMTALLFPTKTIPALLVLGISDAIATLTGYYYGKTKVPLTNNKTILGSASFFLSSLAIIYFFTDLVYAIVCALISTVVELIEFKNCKLLDDNIVIPLTVATSLTIIALIP